MKKVSIIGRGYVGKAIAAMFERGPYLVHTYDKMDEPCWRRDHVQGADLAVVCVPTPPLPDGSADVSAVEEVVGWLDAELILVKSTVPPGTTDRLCRETGKRVCFSPEYVGEPRNFVPPWRYPDPRDPRSHDFVIVGGPPGPAADALNFFLPVLSTDACFVTCTALEAELCKYMENTFLATKVTFCNEWAAIASAFSVDYKRLRELWLLDPRVGGSHTLVHPDAPGFDGKCLPKDTAAIVAAAERQGYVPALLHEVLASNQRFRGEVDVPRSDEFEVVAPGTFDHWSLTVQSRVKVGGKPVPLITELMYDVCGKDTEKFEKVVDAMRRAFEAGGGRT